MLSKETEIPIFGGQYSSLRLEKFDQFDQVYTIKNGVIQPHTKVNQTQEISSIAVVQLRNGMSFICSPTTKIGLRNGEFREAQVLFPGIILWRFHLTIDLTSNEHTFRHNNADEFNDDVTVEKVIMQDGVEEMISLQLEDSDNFAININRHDIGNGINKQLFGVFVRS